MPLAADGPIFGRLVGRITRALDQSPWVEVSALIAFAAPLLRWQLPTNRYLTSYSAVWIFATFMASSIALLALQYTLAIFRAQQLASRLPTALVRDLFQPLEHRASFWRLLTVLITSLLALGPIGERVLPSSAATVAVVDALLLIISIGSIVRSSPRVFDPDYSRSVSRLIVARLGDGYLNQQHARVAFPPPSLAAGVETDQPDPFALIEETCVRAMSENDPTTARLVLRSITGRVLRYLEGREFTARGILAWLGEVLATVGRRAAVIDERTAILAVLLFQESITWALEHRLAWHRRIELLSSFRELRHAAIREGRTAIVKEGLYAMIRTFEIAVKAAPPEARIWSLFLKEPQQPPHDSGIELEWEHLHEHWIWELGTDMDLMSTHGLEDAFNTGQYNYRSMMEVVIGSQSLGPRQKRFLILQLTWAAGHAVRSALRKGRGEGFARWPFEFETDALDKQQLSDLVPIVFEEWERVLVASVEKRQLSRMVLNLFAAAGRGFAREALDERAIRVVQTIEKVAMMSRGQAADEIQAGYEYAVDAIKSIGEFDKRTTSEVRTAVAAALKALGENGREGSAAGHVF